MAMTGKSLGPFCVAAVFAILATCLLPAYASPTDGEKELIEDFWERTDMSNKPGSVVLRIDLDLDGDGQAEILLANQENHSKHGEQDWQIYKRVGGSQYRYIGYAGFSQSSFQVLQNPPRLEAFSFSDAHEDTPEGIQRSASVVTYLFGPTGMIMDSMIELDEAEVKAKLAQMEAWRNAVKPHFYGAEVDKDGKFANPIWDDWQTRKPAEGAIDLETLVVIESPSPKMPTAADFNEQGMQLMQQKNFERAAAKFKTALLWSDHKNALYANNAGFALYKAQSYDKAVEWFKTTIGLDRNRAVAYLNLGDALVKLSRNDEAREEYKKYLDLAPDSKSAPDVKRKLESLSAGGQAADESLLDHLIDLSGAPLDTDTRKSVLRMELDITGDGKPEVLLAATWTGSPNGMLWVVYTPKTNGRYQPLGVLLFGYDTFYYSALGSYVCSAVHTGSTMPGFAYYRVGIDGIREITDESFRPLEDPVVTMDAWQKRARPPVYEDTLEDLRTSAAPQWKDADAEKPVPAIGKLDAKVTETGACSAEKFLQDYRNAGCVPTH
jgi:tetratricopeptide (TPR) repeat protein